MGKALIIGAGGVASVVVHKCCQNSEVFEEICIASRTKSKCDALKEKLDGGKTKITTAQVDADKVEELVALINDFKPDIVINVALPYQDLTIMDACLETKTPDRCFDPSFRRHRSRRGSWPVGHISVAGTRQPPASFTQGPSGRRRRHPRIPASWPSWCRSGRRCGYR